MVDTVASRELEPLARGPESVYIHAGPWDRDIAGPHGRSPRSLDSLFCQNRFSIARPLGPRHETSVKLPRDLDTLGLGFAN